MMQLTILFSLQHYFTPKVSTSFKGQCVSKATDHPNDFKEIPEIDELVLDEEKGDERSHPFSRFMADQPTYELLRGDFLINAYGEHPFPSQSHHVPTYLLKRVLLI